MNAALRVSAPMIIPAGGGLGRSLARAQVFKVSCPAPMKGNDLAGFFFDPPAPPPPSAWDSANKALSSASSTINAATSLYSSRQDMKAATANAALAERQAAAAATAAKLQAANDEVTARMAALSAPKGLPPWALPAIIGGVVLLGVGAFFYFRKKPG